VIRVEMGYLDPVTVYGECKEIIWENIRTGRSNRDFVATTLLWTPGSYFEGSRFPSLAPSS